MIASELSKLLIANYKLNQQEAIVLIEHMTSLNRLQQKISTTIIDHSLLNTIYVKAQQINAGLPLEYITNKASFWDFHLYVDPNVLIPRPETELLVEVALEKLRENKNSENHIPNILELGTGSGAIIIALAKMLSHSTCVAIDLSENALMVARKNAKEILDNKNIEFVQSNWLQYYQSLQVPTKFDLIISNPPYIAEDSVNVTNSVKYYEPEIALYAKEHGMSCLKTIIIDSYPLLISGGYLILEHGFDQKTLVTDLLIKSNYHNINTIKDYAWHDRITIAQKL